MPLTEYERTSPVCVDGELLSERAIEAGGPQGSVLGPVLYPVYTNDMPLVPKVTFSLYADDSADASHRRHAATDGLTLASA
ncbi:hypothetical protein J6590_104922 [Homalodisca vitripennis]|nr:hypothetical protein J6590_104922 [Homalodisca vitripennis]